MKRSEIIRILACVMITAIVTLARPIMLPAHGGIDDDEPAKPAPASVPGASANMLTTFGATEQFELLLKYPPPDIGAPVSLHFFLSDYATNRALENGSIALEFHPAGVTIIHAPVMVSPGVYDAEVSFPLDTAYTLVATVHAGGRADFLELKNIYSGTHAREFIAGHAAAPLPAKATGAWPGWVIAAIIAVIIIAIFAVIFIMRRKQSARVVKVYESKS